MNSFLWEREGALVDACFCFGFDLDGFRLRFGAEFAFEVFEVGLRFGFGFGFGFFLRFELAADALYGISSS